MLEQVTIQVKKQQLLNKGISNDIIDKLLQADPTNKNKSDSDKVGSYTDWITSRYLKDRIFSDFDKLYKQLEQYDKSKNKIPDPKLRNISQFKTLDDLIMYVNNNQDKLAIKTNDFIVEEKTDYDMFYSRNFIIQVPHTKEQSIKLGSGTKWCTSQKKNNQFRLYYEDGYLFYITNKITNQKKYNLYLYKIGIKIEFADDKNRFLTYKLFDIVKEDNTLIPQIKSYYEYKNIEPVNIVQKFLDCKTVSDVVTFWKDTLNAFADIYFEKDEAKLLKSINIIGSNIKFIPNPSIELQLQQLKKDINNLKYIESPDINILKNLIARNKYQIRYIINAGIKPHHDVQLQQVLQDGNQIYFIVNAGIKPEHDVQLQQVSQDGQQISYIINAGIKPRHDVQLQQVSQNGEQIKYIIDAGVQPENKNEWHEIQLQQVTNRGYQIWYIIEAGIKPDHDVQLQQVTQNGYQIRYIDYPNERIQLQQIKKNPDQYKFITNPTPKQTQLYKQLIGIKESTGYISKLLDVN